MAVGNLICSLSFLVGVIYLVIRIVCTPSIGAGKKAIVVPRTTGSGESTFELDFRSTRYVSPFRYQMVIVPDDVVGTISVDQEIVKMKYGLPVSLEIVVGYGITAQDGCPIGTYREYARGESHGMRQTIYTAVKAALDEVLGEIYILILNSERNKISVMIRDLADVGLRQTGLALLSFTIRDLSDHDGYLEGIEDLRAWPVGCDAIQGQATAYRSAGQEEKAKRFTILERGKVDDEAIAHMKRLIEIGIKYGIPFSELVPDGMLVTWEKLGDLEEAQRNENESEEIEDRLNDKPE